MKSTKLIIAISELWNGNQRSCVRNCLLRGIEEINKKVDINDIIEELNSKDMNKEIELETCIVQTIIDVDKVSFLNAVKEDQSYKRLLIVYVGAISSPWGQWLLRDGIVSAVDLMELIDNAHCKLVMATLAPCDDWLTAEKKIGDTISVCNYDMTECGDPIALGLSDFVDSVCRCLKITPCSIKKHDTTSFLKATQPSVCGFLDKGCSTMPCLVLIDGFSMLFNVGYGRNPEMRSHLKYLAQVDAALLSHIGYNNILPLSCVSQDSESVKINHLFVPYGVNLNDKVSGGDSENPYIVDLNNEVSKILSAFKDKGTSVSNIFVKGKTGTPVSTSQLKPIPMFQKIGYGSLELIALAPFEDDADVKKCSEDLKKGKYLNEGQVRPLPLSVSVLLLWKPFNPKVATKRFLYIGSRSQLRKNLPAMATALYNNNECLKQAEHSLIDANNKKAAVRKVVAQVPVVGKTTTKVNDTTNADHAKKVAPSLSTEKSSKLSTTSETVKKPVASATASHSNKSARPATATAASTQPKPKDPQVAKRPTTATAKPKTDTSKSTEVKKTGPKTPVNVTGTKQTTKKTTTTNVDHNNEEKHKNDAVPIVNGQKEHSEAEVVMNSVTQDGDLTVDAGKMVAVGTVECAITEHGEADFCDDTPEEYSAEQMKELGLYDDDEDRSSAPLSDVNDLDGTDSGNIAHLPMEGSFYGKDTFEELNDHSSRWQKPLGMPIHAKDTTSATKKAVKCVTPIHVDCVCVPSDLDKEDLRCLFNHVRFMTGFLQVDKAGDLPRSLDMLMEEWGNEGALREVTVVPSMDDETSLAWLKDNEARLNSCKIRVATALTRCSIVIGGDNAADNECLGFRCDL